MAALGLAGLSLYALNNNLFAESPNATGRLYVEGPIAARMRSDFPFGIGRPDNLTQWEARTSSV